MAFFLLFVLWIVLNGKVTLEIVLVGAALSVFFALASKALLRGESPHLGQRFSHCLPGVLFYGVYLTGQILISNLQVIRLILSPRAREGRPLLVWFTPELERKAARLGLANSITLTPGTITVSMGEKTLGVYALRPEFAEGLKDSGFVKRLQRLEEKGNG